MFKRFVPAVAVVNAAASGTFDSVNKPDIKKALTKKPAVNHRAKRSVQNKASHSKSRRYKPTVGKSHPVVGQTPDGSNLDTLYNFPNCESPCYYEGDQSEFADLLDQYDDQVWPGGYAIGEIFATSTNDYDSGTTLVVYPASCTDIDNVNTCTVDDSGSGESDWELLYVNVWGYFFGEAMTQYNYILSIPDSTSPGE